VYTLVQYKLEISQKIKAFNVASQMYSEFVQSKSILVSTIEIGWKMAND